MNSEDAFLVLPKSPDRRGSEYYTLGHRGSTGDTSRWLVSANPRIHDLHFKDCSGSTATPVDVTSSYVYQSTCAVGTTGQDGTGNLVYSDDDVKFGLISGATCAYVPATIEASDVLAEMQPGNDWWGIEYLVTEFNKGAGATVLGDLIRIVSTAASNVVTFTAVTGGAISTENSSGQACGSTSGHTFAAGEWCDILVEVGAIIESEDPIVVGQFMKGNEHTEVGDPSLSLVLPTNRFRCGGPFYSFEGFDNVDENGSYVNIVAPTSAIASIELDNRRLDATTTITCNGYSPIEFTGTSYSWTKCLLADPGSPGTQHRINSGTTPIGVYVYGQQAISGTSGAYSYVGGMSF